MTRCDSDRDHTWAGQSKNLLDNFEVNHDEIFVDAECELCGAQAELTLDCRNPNELESDYQDWQNKEQQPTNDIHAVLIEVVDADFESWYPYAEAKLAVYYDGQHDPDYPLENTYIYEV